MSTFGALPSFGISLSFRRTAHFRNCTIIAMTMLHCIALPTDTSHSFPSLSTTPGRISEYA